MTSSPTVKLSFPRVSIRYVAAFALLWLGLPALAMPAPDIDLIPGPVMSQQPSMVRQVGAPTIVFAKKNGKGGGGSSGSGQGNNTDKKDKKDYDDKRDEDRDDGKDDKDKKDKKDKDKKDKDKKDKDKKDKDKKDKDKKDKKDKDKKDKDKKDKDKKDKEGGDSAGQDEREADDDWHDHDRNERHGHDNGEADERHDHETEEERHYRHGDEESDTGGAELAHQDDQNERDAGESVSSGTRDDGVGEVEDTSGEEPDEEAPSTGAESASSDVPGVVTLSWTPPTENEDGSPLLDLAGYQIYWRDTTGIYNGSMKIDNPGLSTIVIGNLPGGTYEFAMSSVNTAGIESARSNTVTRVVAAGSEPVAPEVNTATGNPAPHLMISGTPAEAVIAGHLYLFTPGLESSGEDTPVFVIEGLPHWAGFDDITGELYGTPDEADIGFYEAITISATDGVVETSLPTFSIEVVAPGAAPGAVTLSWMPPTANEDGSYLFDLAGYWIYWGNNSGQYTQWMRIDNPGLTTVVIENLVPGSWEFAMTSFNAAGIESSLSNAVSRFVDQ